MSKVKNGFDKMSDAKLLVESNTIATKCKGNPFFTAEQPTVTLLETANTAFTEALSDANSGSYQAIAEKNAQRIALIALLRKLCDLVSATAGDDMVKLISSGVPLRKTPEQSAPLVKPAPPVLSAGSLTGEVISEGKRQNSALAMVHMSTPDPLTPNSVWTSTISGSRKFVFDGLESGQRCWFKLGMVGVRNQYEESDAVSYVVQ